MIDWVKLMHDSIHEQMLDILLEEIKELIEDVK